ncbi:MAG TPA: YdcF family protein [Thermomicrobiales bacterium]
MQSAQDTERVPLPRTETHRPPPATPPAEALKRRRFRRPFLSELWRWAVTGVITLVLAVALLSGSLLLAIFRQARLDQSQPADAIVVLGAAQYDGRPSPVLEARLETALAAYQAGLAPLIVVTGGRQEGDRFTEAETERAYLIDHGVPASAILSENEGRSSWESMQGVAAILDERDLTRVLLVSDGFHLFRLKLMARELGLTAYGIPARNSPIRPRSGAELDYVIREAAGVVAFVAGMRDS